MDTNTWGECLALCLFSFFSYNIIVPFFHEVYLDFISSMPHLFALISTIAKVMKRDGYRQRYVFFYNTWTFGSMMCHDNPEIVCIIHIRWTTYTRGAKCWIRLISNQTRNRNEIWQVRFCVGCEIQKYVILFGN